MYIYRVLEAATGFCLWSNLWWCLYIDQWYIQVVTVTQSCWGLKWSLVMCISLWYACKVLSCIFYPQCEFFSLWTPENKANQVRFLCMNQACLTLWPEKCDLSASLTIDFLLPQTLLKKLRKMYLCFYFLVLRSNLYSQISRRCL